MNVTLPKKEKGTKRRITMYIVIFVICVIAIGIAIHQVSKEEIEEVSKTVNPETEEIQKLKDEFNNLFNNNLIQQQSNQEIKKIDQEQNIVYTIYEKEEKEDSNFDININIPSINIDSNITKEFNEDIKRNFQIPAQKILQTQNKNIAYTVNYTANLENNILSVVILSTLKEDSNNQRTIVKTYNYNIKENKEITLEDFLKINNIEKTKAQEKIKQEIEKSEEQTEKLRELGYNIFSRNSSDSRYKLENTTEFFMYNNNLYLIYAYGNERNTSEMDLIIL